MQIKEGQRVRVFGVVKGSWIIGQVYSFDATSVTVAVYDWVGIPPSFYSLPYDQIEVIANGI